MQKHYIFSSSSKGLKILSWDRSVSQYGHSQISASSSWYERPWQNEQDLNGINYTPPVKVFTEKQFLMRGFGIYIHYH